MTGPYGHTRVGDVVTDPAAHDVPLGERWLCGDPIDVATGWVVLPRTDVELAGALPLTLSRTHLSSYRLGRAFGASWASTVDQRVEEEPDALHLVLADGTLLGYPVPVNGSEVLPNSGPRFPLRRVRDGYEVIDRDASRLLRFGDHLESIVDGDGNRVDFRRDGTGNLTAVEHSGGYRLDVATGDGLVTAIGTGDTELARYRYENRRLVEVTDANGAATRFAYDADGRVTSWEDADGWYRYHFDALGRVVRAEGTGGYLDCLLAYDDDVTTVTNSLGHVTRYRLDERLRVVAETNPLGNTTRYERDEWGRLSARVDPLGRVTRYERDETGRVTAVTRPDGSRATREYDGRHRPVVTTGPDGAVWRREYDARGRLVRTSDPTGAVTVRTHDENGNVATVTDPLGGVTHVESNAAGLPVAVTDPVGAVTRYTYDDLGHVSTVTDPLGGVTTMTWDATGELRERTGPDGAVWRWHAGVSIDPRGGRTAAEYAHFDLLVAETAPDGGRLSYAYDTELRLVSVTNEEGLVWRYTYDPAGNLVSETDYNGRTTRYGYDAAGQMTVRANGAGETVVFERDVLGRVVRRQTAAGVATFTYDAAGRLTVARNADAELRFVHDALGRVVAESINGRTVRSEYDLAGRRTTRRTPSGAQSRFTYDEADHPIALYTAGRSMRFEHDRCGRELVRRLHGLCDDTEIELRQSWDAVDRLATQTVRGGGRTVAHREYDYLPDGHVSRVTDTHSGTRTLDVDPAGRVRAVRGRWQERYEYTLSGLVRTASLPGAGGPRGYRGTLLAAAADVVHAHDAEGRTTARGDWRFEWQDERLTGVTTPDGLRWRYRYDALGRRIAKQRLDRAGRIAEQVQFTWDGTHLAEEVRSGTGSAVAMVWEWLPGTDRVVTQTRRVLGQSGTDFHAVVTDQAGTPTELVDEAGDVAWQVGMTLWGRVLSPPGTAYTPLRFPGQYHDTETGLHYNLHRYYDPDTGRYLSHDPLGIETGRDSLAYVTNPTTMTDPLGLSACPVTGGRNTRAAPNPVTLGGTWHEQARLDRVFDPAGGPVYAGTFQAEYPIGYEPPGTDAEPWHVSARPPH